jgi:glycosyltransferase involved in cell wall biosynthesis
VPDVAELLSSCDCVVAAGRGEAAGMSILEAIAAAKWVIATADGGGAELVEEGVTGSVVVADENALAQALMRAAAGPLEYVRNERLDVCRARFSADAMGRATMDQYDSVLASRDSCSSG